MSRLTIIIILVLAILAYSNFFKWEVFNAIFYLLLLITVQLEVLINKK